MRFISGDQRHAKNKQNFSCFSFWWFQLNCNTSSSKLGLMFVDRVSALFPCVYLGFPTCGPQLCFYFLSLFFPKPRSVFLPYPHPPTPPFSRIPTCIWKSTRSLLCCCLCCCLLWFPACLCVRTFARLCFLDHRFGALHFWVCPLALLDQIFWPFALFTSSWPSTASLYPRKPQWFFWRLINIAEPKLLCLRRLHRDPKAQIQACLAHTLPICFRH